MMSSRHKSSADSSSSSSSSMDIDIVSSRSPSFAATCPDGNDSRSRSEWMTSPIPCLESYRLFKKCSSLGETETISCGAVVAEYMHCAMGRC
ncbi:hypothetical protein ACHAXS_002594 [Conticribra weissflogii]